MQPVRFMDGLGELIKTGNISIFIEVGPHPVLATAIKECTSHFTADSKKKILLKQSIKRKEPERTAMLQTLAFLYLIEFYCFYFTV